MQKELCKVRDSIRTRINYNSTYQLYAHSNTGEWNYSQKWPQKGDVIKGTRRMYLHIYYNGEKALEHEIRFNEMLDMLENELTTGNRKKET